MVQTKKFISFILVLAMVLSTMFAVSVPVFAVSTYSASWTNNSAYKVDFKSQTDDGPKTTDSALTDIVIALNGNGNQTISAIRVSGPSVTLSRVPENKALITVADNAQLTITSLIESGDYLITGEGNSKLVVNDPIAKVTATAGVYQTITVEAGTVDLQGVNADALVVNGGTVYGYGTIGTANVNGGKLYLGYTAADVDAIAATHSAVSKGLDAAGGVTNIANTTISDSTLAFAENNGIVNISPNAIVNLNEDASISQIESTRADAGTMLAVFNAGTLTMTGSSIAIKTDGNTLSKGTVALRGIYNYMSGSVTNIISGSISLINGNDDNIAVYNQGALTLGVHDDVLQNVTITVDEDGKGIETVGNGSLVTIYDADINVTGGYGTGILARQNTVLEILSGPDTVGAVLPTPTVSVDADLNNGTALQINDNVQWAIAGGYKTAVFSAKYALDNSSTNTPNILHDVYESGKPLTAGYFIGEIGGAVSDLNNLIPSTNYVVDNESANVNAVVDLRWEVQNAFEAGTPVETNDTSKNGNTYTYSLPKDITFGEDSSLHGRTATTTVALDANDGREIVWNGHTIDHCTSAGATSTTTESALFYYTQSVAAAPNGSANLYYNLGTGAYLEYSTAPGLTADYSDLSSLIGVANSNNPGYLSNVVVFKGAHLLNVTPTALNNPILVKPHEAEATTLTITGDTAYTYHVMGVDEGVDASTYANLVVNAANADVYVSGEFASVDVQAGTVHIDSGAQVVSLTQRGGTLYTANGVTSDGTHQVALNAAVGTSATAAAIGTYRSVSKNGAGELILGDETNAAQTDVAEGLTNNEGTTTVVYTTISAVDQGSEGSRVVSVGGGDVILATSSIYKNNKYDTISGKITGVYVGNGATLTMLTGSSIYLQATAEQDVALYGVDNHGTADLQSGSIELVKGSPAGNYGVENFGLVKLGVYDDTTASVKISVDKAGTGLYTHADSDAYVYGTEIVTKLGGTGIKAGSGETDTSNLIIMAGTSTVSAVLPTPTVSVTTEGNNGTALQITDNVRWAIAGGYKTAVFTGATALDTKSSYTPTDSNIHYAVTHNTNEYALTTDKPLTAGYFVGNISGTYGLDDLVPSESTSHSEVTNYMTTGQAIVDLSWELKNVMEEYAATNSNYSNTTYTFPACISYDKISTTLHGHYEGDPVVHTSNAGITIDLGKHSWSASDGAIALEASKNVYITNGGIVKADSNDAIVHNGGLLFIEDSGVVSLSGSAIDNIDGTVLGLFNSVLVGTKNTLDIASGPAFMTDSVVIASDNAIKHDGSNALVIIKSTVGATAGHAVEHVGSGNFYIVSGGAFTSQGGNVIELQGSGNVSIADAEITAKDSYIAIKDQLASPGSLNIEDATVTAASGHAIDYQGVTDLDITNSTVSAVNKNAICNDSTGILTVSGGTITSTNGEAVYIDNTGASFIDGATVSSQNNNAIHQKKGDLTITSGAFGSTSGHAVWVEAGANMLTIVDGTFTAADGYYGLLVEDPADLTPLNAGTFSSVKNNTPSGILYQLVEKTGKVPAYTFRDNEGDLLSAWDLHKMQEITGSAIATFYASNAALAGPFTVVARPAYEVYYTSSEAISHTAASATALKGNDGDWNAMYFTTGTAVTVTATAADGYLVKDAAHMTYGAFVKQACSFAAIDLQGDAANQASYAVNLDGSEDYVMSVTGAAAKTVTLSAVENYDHGSFGYKFVNADNGNADYTVSQQDRVTASAVSGVAIKVADGNAISLGFKPDTDHAVHESTTAFGGLAFTKLGGSYDTKDSLVTGSAVVSDNHTVEVAFCDMTAPVDLTPSAVSFNETITNGSSKTLNATQTIKALDSHYELAATKGAWTITSGASIVTFSGVSGTASGASVVVQGIDAGTAEVTFTPQISGGAVLTNPASVKWIINVVAPTSGGGGSVGGGGGGAAASYDVSVTTDSSDIKADKTKAAAGDTVTITVPEGTTGVTITDEKGNVIPVTKVNDTTYTFKMPSSKVKVATEKATGLIRFVDVPMDKYYYDAVNWAVANGITTGTDATHFSPDALTDRAQFVTFLWRAAGSPEPTGDASTFKDVSSDKYYAKAVAWAVENGITNGLEADQFGPTVPVSRAHVVTFLYRFAKAAGTYSSDFVDLKKGDFYEDAAGWAVENGITTGIDATHFNPDGPAVRAQTITFLYRYFTK